jgi:ubiquitin carboxyl-terminal hydrolase 5/13
MALFSCYMASVLQVLFSLPRFQERYYGGAHSEASDHWATCRESLPAHCLECQMFKLSDGLLSGRYSNPQSEPHQKNLLSSLSVEQVDSAHPVSENVSFQAGLKPTGFKALVGKGHAEFSTMRQQDAQEFLQHLLTVLRRFNHKANSGVPDYVSPNFSTTTLTTIVQRRPNQRRPWHLGWNNVCNAYHATEFVIE